MRLSPIFFACMHLIVGVPQPGHNSPNLPGTFKPPTTGPGTKNPGTTPGNNNPGTIPGQHSVKPGNIDKQPSDTTNKKHTCKHIHGSLTRPKSTPDNTSQTASCKDNFGSLATGYAKGYDWGKFFFFFLSGLCIVLLIVNIIRGMISDPWKDHQDATTSCAIRANVLVGAQSSFGILPLKYVHCLCWADFRCIQTSWTRKAVKEMIIHSRVPSI